MNLLRQPLQNKLSRMLGADVRIGSLSISLLAGTIEAQDIAIAGRDSDEPLLIIGQIRASIAIARALKGEIAITSLTIERPILSIRQYSDGSTNLPKPRQSTASDEPHESDPTADPSRWRLDVQNVLLLDGEVQFMTEKAPMAGYHLVAHKILADLKQSAGGFDFTCIIDALRRTDEPAELGTLKCDGSFNEVTDLRRLSEAPLRVRAHLNDRLHAEFRSPALRSKHASADVHGVFALHELKALLPATMRSTLLQNLAGRIELAARLSHQPATGLILSELTLRATDVAKG